VFRGGSGSPVFNRDNDKLEGILHGIKAGGPTADFDDKGSCKSYFYCGPFTGCGNMVVMRVTEFAWAVQQFYR
jgi:hypothetical protein